MTLLNEYGRPAAQRLQLITNESGIVDIAALAFGRYAVHAFAGNGLTLDGEWQIDALQTEDVIQLDSTAGYGDLTGTIRSRSGRWHPEATVRIGLRDRS